MKRNNGFTLIELMIMIAILAVIAAIAIPALMGTTQKSSTFGVNGMTETRCIEGYKFVVGASGTTSQMMDAQGNGIPCQQ